MFGGELAGIYNDMGDAIQIGDKLFGEGNFILQRIGEKAIHVRAYVG